MDVLALLKLDSKVSGYYSLLLYRNCLFMSFAKMSPLPGRPWSIVFAGKKLNELMESKGGKKKSSSSKSLFYEAPLGYSIEDVRPHGGIKKFRSAAYSNVSFTVCFWVHVISGLFCMNGLLILPYTVLYAVRPQAILSSAKSRHNPVRSLILQFYFSSSLFLFPTSLVLSRTCSLASSPLSAVATLFPSLIRDGCTGLCNWI